MFYINYMFSELRRRKGRTLLTALGLAVGVGLVVTINALSTGLDQAQAKVLAPLTGVGTDMSVTRPITVSTSGSGSGGFRGLSATERAQLQKETGRRSSGSATSRRERTSPATRSSRRHSCPSRPPRSLRFRARRTSRPLQAV